MWRACLFVVCWSLAADKTVGQQAPLFAPPSLGSHRAPAASIKVLAYNVHLLPNVALKVAGNRGDTEYRAEEIGKKMADYDIVGLCEVFDPRHSQKLYDAAQTATNNAFQIAYGPKRIGVHLIGSGLAILSRFPVEDSHTVSYTEASRFVDSGFKADGFAAKGAVHARIRINDKPPSYLDCFLTHLESRSGKARDVQISEFTDFVTKYTGNDPIIVMGDFNIAANAPDGSAEQQQLESLRSKLTQKGRRFIDVWEIAGQGTGYTNEPVPSGGKRRIDYIFISDPANVSARLSPLEVRVLPFLDDKVEGGSLSDHSAVSCTLELAGPPPPTGLSQTIR